MYKTNWDYICEQYKQNWLQVTAQKAISCRAETKSLLKIFISFKKLKIHVHCFIMGID